MTLLSEDVWSGTIHSGGWRVGGGGVSTVIEPATGQPLGLIGVASTADVARAASAAAAAQHDWAKRPPHERSAVLRRAGLLFEERAAEIENWIVRETGAIPPKAQLETRIAAQECFEASALPSFPHGDVIPSDEARWSFARRRAAGVVTVIAPFNFPLILAIRAVAPALALGNAVLLKPDLRTAVSGGVSIMHVFEDAGLPDGLLHLLPGGADVGEAAVAAPEVRIIAFTGSTTAGRAVGALAAHHLKRVHLELGGNNALVVLPGADVQLAASAGAFGSFMHQGQICMATGRHLVHESLLEQYLEILSEKAEHLPIGDPATSAVALGPIIDEKQLLRIDSLVQRSLAQGARLTAGATYDGQFYRPTVLADVDSTMPAWTDEVFGPVAPVRSFSTVEEAAKLASENDYGLALGILGDVGLAMDLADMVPSGKIHINEQTISDEANAPFGGVGWSGNGARIGGLETNLDAFTDTQWLTMRSTIAPYPF